MSHNHPMPAETDSRTAHGEPLDTAPLRALIGAAHTGCRPCQDKWATVVLDSRHELVTHAAGTAYLGLVRLGVPQPTSDSFPPPMQLLVRAFNRDDVKAAEDITADLLCDERRQILDHAVDLLTAAIAARATEGRGL